MEEIIYNAPLWVGMFLLSLLSIVVLSVIMDYGICDNVSIIRGFFLFSTILMFVSGFILIENVDKQKVDINQENSSENSLSADTNKQGIYDVIYDEEGNLGVTFDGNTVMIKVTSIPKDVSAENYIDIKENTYKYLRIELDDLIVTEDTKWIEPKLEIIQQENDSESNERNYIYKLHIPEGFSLNDMP